jgi:hypothetical protein
VAGPKPQVMGRSMTRLKSPRKTGYGGMEGFQGLRAKDQTRGKVLACFNNTCLGMKSQGSGRNRQISQYQLALAYSALCHWRSDEWTFL